MNSVIKTLIERDKRLNDDHRELLLDIFSRIGDSGCLDIDETERQLYKDLEDLGYLEVGSYISWSLFDETE